MCDPVITPQVPKIDKLPLGARVFIEGKNRPLHVAEDHTEVSLQLNDATRNAIVVTNLNGEATTIPVRRVVSAVAPTPSDRTPIKLESGALWGKSVTVRGLRPDDDFAADAEKLGIGTENCAVVLGEDMASVEIVVYDLTSGDVVWANPACTDREIRRAKKIAQLAAEMEQLAAEQVMAEPGPRDDQDNATAWLRSKGTLAEAISTADAGFVLGYLSEAASGPDVAVKLDLHDTAYGVITAFDGQAFEIDLFDGGQVKNTPLSGIVGVVSWSWSDYQRTGNPTEFLTEFGRSVESDLPVANN